MERNNQPALSGWLFLYICIFTYHTYTMKRFDILRTMTFLILAYGIFSGNSCFKTNNTEADSKCGEEHIWSKTFGGGQPKYTALKGNIREFIFEDSTGVENICSEEHINVTYFVELDPFWDHPPDSFSVSGHSYWSLFGGTSPMPPTAGISPIEYKATENIGLKQAFPDRPGSVGLQVIFRFPTTGNEQEDREFIYHTVSQVIISCKYRLSL